MLQFTKNHWVTFGMLAMGLLPVLVFQPTGAAGAGLTGGFALPLEHPAHALFFLGVGIAAMALGGQAGRMLPLAVAAMLVIGAGSDVAILEIHSSKALVFAAVLLFALAVSAGYSRQFLPLVAVSSAIAFYIGAAYAATLPGIASMSFYLSGAVLSGLALMACGASLVYAGLGYWRKLGEKLKELPAMASFLSLF